MQCISSAAKGLFLSPLTYRESEHNSTVQVRVVLGDGDCVRDHFPTSPAANSFHKPVRAAREISMRDIVQENPLRPNGASAVAKLRLWDMAGERGVNAF